MIGFKTASDTEKFQAVVRIACDIVQSLTELPYVDYVKSDLQLQTEAAKLGLPAQRILNVISETAERQRRRAEQKQ